MSIHSRRYDIDALRFLVFSLLIAYHTAMLYLDGAAFHMKSTYLTETLNFPMVFINRWRMEIVFLISGVSCAMMTQASRGAFLRRRLARLLLPLLFGVLLVVPVQPYCEGVSNGLVEPGYGQFLLHYFGGYAWPAGAFTGWKTSFTWNHLWYLVYLLLYTLVLAALQPLLAQARPLFTRLRGWRLLILPALPTLAATVFLKLRYPENHALLKDWYAHAIYFTMYLYGWWLGNDKGVWQELARLRWHALLLAPCAFAVYLGFDLVYSENLLTWASAGSWPMRNLYMWLAICAILGWSHTLLNRPFSWLPWARQAVFPWYILHQSAIVLLAYWLVPLRLGPVLEPLLILAGTVALCWLGTSLLISKVSWLRPCFGLPALPQRAVAADTALPAN
ncbi:acyltransferase family protein [Janthinobacterium sp. 1_2014MBL_MicDiv]|uniref:acyltransferase family protein n=1 Tax=Janthinobacterium sp. 1_2014MBL_MicDiv TaxID=1644131 RepID=UPI0008F52639|nr:acyltransferase family protein [Janthinobacterium sp. 1_2014MBL_MicDiv]APA66506.1 membrane protein [Janthinobacterium sp. 1_2014MBL_MicDiv]